MSMMSDFEIRANNIVTGIELTGHRVQDFGYSEDSPTETISRVVGMFITWLTACEESRLQGSFSTKVINQLPTVDDPNWDDYIMPPPSSTLRQRAEALWGIRIAFTHGDGDTNLITNPTNKQYAIDSANIFDDVKLDDNARLILNDGLYHEAIRTIVQIRDLLP